MKTILLQDGSNSILKERDKNVDVLFANYNNLLKAVDEKFNPDKLVLMQVPPSRNCQNNGIAKERNNQFNF